MDETPSDDGQLDQPETGGSSGGRGRQMWLVITVVVGLVALAALIGFIIGRGDDTDEVFTTETTPTTETTATSTSPSATTETDAGDTAPTTSATRDLDAFLTQARTADQALSEAASRINDSTTSTEITYDQQTVDLLASAAPDTVAPLLPPGMPAPLRDQALLVYSGLVSRWAAMDSLCSPEEVGTYPRSRFDDLGCFTGGAAAAARFDSDLAALETMTETTPPFAIPSPDSQAAEELAALIQVVDIGNLGCAGVGGFVATEPMVVVWQDHPAEGDQPPWQGTVDGIEFRGTYDPASGWTIEVNAC